VIEDVEVKEIGDVSATITWNTNEAASRFVYFGAGDSLGQSVGQSDYGTEHALTLTNLSSSTTYNFRVESVDPVGNSSGQGLVSSFTTTSGPDLEAPPALSGFVVTMGLESALLSWRSSGAADLASYSLYRSTGSGAFTAIATGLADTFYADEGLAFGSTYTYYVTASDLAGNEADPSSQEGDAASIRNVPSTVAAIAGSNAGTATTLTVVNAVPGKRGGPLSYTFHVSTTELFDDIVASGTGIAEGSPTTVWTFEKELEPGREYYWRARASDGVFDGPWSFPSFFVAEGGTPGDFNGDGQVGFDDFFAFVDVFGLSKGSVGFDPVFDMNGDDAVGFDDFFLFVDVFGSVYSSPRRVAAASEGMSSGVTLASSVDGEDVIVEVAVEELERVRGAGLVLGYDPWAMEFVGASADESGLLGGLSYHRRLHAAVETGDDEIAVFAYRLGSETDGEGAQIASVRFRTQGEREGARIELRALAVQTGDGVYRLPAPIAANVRLVPENFTLRPNYPNPFNPETTISYDVPKVATVELAVYDVLGQEIRTLVAGQQAAGHYRIRWDGLDDAGSPVSSGVYLVSLRSGQIQAVRKMLLIR